MIKGQAVEPKDVLRFQISRCITVLFKNYLTVLEDLGVDHDSAMEKLYNSLPEQYKTYVKLADYLDEAKSNLLRSKILGGGNDCIRELEQHLENYNITFKNKHE